MDGLVRALLADHLVEAVEAPPTFTLLSTASEERMGRGLWLVYRSQRQIARRRSEAGALRALLAQLEGVARAEEGRYPHLEGAVFTDGNRVAIGPPILRVEVAALKAKLRRTPWSVTDEAGVWLDDGGRAVVPERRLAVDQRVLGRLEGERAPEVTELAPGSYPVAGWLTFKPDPGVSRAHLVASYVAGVENLDAVGAKALVALNAAMDSADTAELETMAAAEVASHFATF
jgi:hypothetical protein